MWASCIRIPGEEEEEEEVVEEEVEEEEEEVEEEEEEEATSINVQDCHSLPWDVLRSRVFKGMSCIWE